MSRFSINALFIRGNNRPMLLMVIAIIMGISLGYLSGQYTAVPGNRDYPGDEIAIEVNGHALKASSYLQLLSLMDRDRLFGIEEADRLLALERLLEEELLVQYGIKSGMLNTNRQIREYIVRAVINSAMIANLNAQPQDNELKAYCRSLSTDDMRNAVLDLPTINCVQINIDLRKTLIQQYEMVQKERFFRKYIQGLANDSIQRDRNEI